MDNLFNILKPNIFSIFSREDRRANYDLLSAVYDFYTKDARTQNVPSEELVEFITEYINDQNVRFLDDDDKIIDLKVPKEIAQRKVRQLKACGWLDEEPIGFTSYIGLNENAIILLDTFKSIVNAQDHPLEYTGYFYFIYNTLVEKFDIKKSKAIIEQVSKNTRELFNSLKGVSSAIKRFIQKIVDNKSMMPQQILDILLNKYQSQVMMTVFNNLKTKDNPSKYSSQILLKLKELRYHKLDEVVRNYIEAMGNTELTSEKYKELETHIRSEIDEIIQKFESVDSVIQVIDERNNKFHNSALTVLNYVMNSRKDIEGQIIKALRMLKDVDEVDDFSDILQISYSKTIDDKSLQSPRTVKRKVKVTAKTAPKIDENELKKKFNNLFGENEFSKVNINKYILNLLAERSQLNVKDIDIHDMSDFIKVFLAQLYVEHNDVSYKIVYSGRKCEVFNYQIDDFVIIRRES